MDVHLIIHSEPEPQILDYVTQQHKLFIGVATSHIFRVTGQWLWDSYSQTVKDVGKGNMDQLPEVGYSFAQTPGFFRGWGEGEYKLKQLHAPTSNRNRACASKERGHK